MLKNTYDDCFNFSGQLSEMSLFSAMPLKHRSSKDCLNQNKLKDNLLNILIFIQIIGSGLQFGQGNKRLSLNIRINVLSVTN